MMHRAKRVRLAYKFCPHCKRECNIKTYKQHKRLFFNSDLKTWYTARTLPEKRVSSDSNTDSLCSFPSDKSNDSEKELLDEVEVNLDSNEPPYACAGITFMLVHDNHLHVHIHVQQYQLRVYRIQLCPIRQ